MRSRYIIWIVWMFWCGLPAFAQPQPSFAGAPPLPAEAGIGEHVTFTGENLTVGKPVTVYLRTGSEKDNNPSKALTGAMVSDANTPGSRLIDFRLADVKPGRYFVSVDIDGKNYAVPGELRVVPSRDVHLDELKPNIVYPDKVGGTFTFDLSGQNFGTEPKDMTLEIDGAGPVRTAVACVAPTDACIQTDRNLPGQVLTVRNLPNRQGEARLRVRVGNSPASNFVPIRFSLIPKSYVRLVTLIIVGLLALTIVAVLLGGQHLGLTTAGRSIANALLLDQQTNTFSLSKFQLLLWTGASVFAYIYLFLCRSLVQWSLEIPPIPDGLPNLLALSVGTTVLSAGVTGIRGSKGAGPESPSIADLFSTGGMIVGERFQFFLWTIVAVFGFVGIVLVNDPATLVTLPPIPDGFLPLMGVSAVGYLGGKLARKPGPVIKTLGIINVDEAAHTMTIALQGENLSSNATFQVDDQLLRADLAKVSVTKSDDPTSDLNTQIQVLFREADAFTVGTHSLKIVNPDGQIAVATFPMDAMTITVPDGGLSVKGGTEEVQLQITGTSFDDKVKATWKPVGADAPTAATVMFVSPTSLIVAFRPGTGAGKGQLVLRSAGGLKAIAEVMVVVV